MQADARLKAGATSAETKEPSHKWPTIKDLRIRIRTALISGAKSAAALQPRATALGFRKIDRLCPARARGALPPLAGTEHVLGGRPRGRFAPGAGMLRADGGVHRSLSFSAEKTGGKAI